MDISQFNETDYMNFKQFIKDFLGTLRASNIDISIGLPLAIMSVVFEDNTFNIDKISNDNFYKLLLSTVNDLRLYSEFISK